MRPRQLPYIRGTIIVLQLSAGLTTRHALWAQCVAALVIRESSYDFYTYVVPDTRHEKGESLNRLLWYDIGSVRSSIVRPAPEAYPRLALHRAPHDGFSFSFVHINNNTVR